MVVTQHAVADTFQSAFDTELRGMMDVHSTASLSSRSFAVGDSVEARRTSSFEDCDVLYYEAKVTAVHRMSTPALGSATTTASAGAGEVTHYDLNFEDDSVQRAVPAAWVIPNTRRIVAERGHARVIIGHAGTHDAWRKGICHGDSSGQAAPGPESLCREVLLMVFTECPTLYQSAVALQSSSSEGKTMVLDHSELPFEQHQCFSLIVALAGGKTSAARALPGSRALSLAMLGGGGCSLPTALRDTFGEALDIDVVELDTDVVTVAREFFGATDSAHFRLREGDAEVFLRTAPEESFDAILVDVASTSASAGADGDDEGMVLPPDDFVSEEFLSGQLARCLAPGGERGCAFVYSRSILTTVCAQTSGNFRLFTPPLAQFPATIETRVLCSFILPNTHLGVRTLRSDGGVCVMNVIGGRAALGEVAERFRRSFPSPGGAAVLCTDPNYLFWGFKGDGGWGGSEGGAPTPKEVLAAAAVHPKLVKLCPFALSLVRDTKGHLEVGDLMGWVTIDEFIAMLADPEVIV